MYALKRAMQRTMEQGVGEKVIVHSRELSLCLTRSGGFTMVPSLELPESYIRGSVGAGDAFCAGALYSIYHGANDSEMLEFASAAGAASLHCENAVDGMLSRQEIVGLMRHFPRQKIDLPKED